jgi:NADPH:quinone reductase-like Zn-dependent oxidoreductase
VLLYELVCGQSPFRGRTLDELCQQAPHIVQAQLGVVMEAFERGDYQPLTLRVFPVERAVEAFRHMAQAQHVGKVVLVA